MTERGEDRSSLAAMLHPVIDDVIETMPENALACHVEFARIIADDALKRIVGQPGDIVEHGGFFGVPYLDQPHEGWIVRRVGIADHLVVLAEHPPAEFGVEDVDERVAQPAMRKGGGGKILLCADLR